MSTLDIQDAYFHITIHMAHREFLCFAIREDHYQYKALPFSICTASRVFTKAVVFKGVQATQTNPEVQAMLVSKNQDVINMMDSDESLFERSSFQPFQTTTPNNNRCRPFE